MSFLYLRPDGKPEHEERVVPLCFVIRYDAAPFGLPTPAFPTSSVPTMLMWSVTALPCTTKKSLETKRLQGIFAKDG